MFINPKLAIEKGWIKGILNPAKQVQPNAIDFTLDYVKSVKVGGIARITEGAKYMRELYDHHTNEKGSWTLGGGLVYDGTSDVFVELPEGVAAVLFTRSTFARNGVFIVSGLYDSGYVGQVGFTIYTLGGMIDIARGTRIGQIAFVHSESAGAYAGGYNHQQGTHYTEEAGRDAVPISPTRQQTVTAPPFGKPELFEQPIGSNPNKTERAQELEDTHRFDSLQGSKPAGTKDFL